jgi:hypothetical protein
MCQLDKNKFPNINWVDDKGATKYKSKQMSPRKFRRRQMARHLTQPLTKKEKAAGLTRADIPPNRRGQRPKLRILGSNRREQRPNSGQQPPSRRPPRDRCPQAFSAGFSFLRDVGHVAEMARALGLASDAREVYRDVRDRESRVPQNVVD